MQEGSSPYYRRHPPRGRDIKGFKEFRRGPRHFIEAKPLPIGEFCNSLCPFFKCAKGALVFGSKVIKGRPQKVAYCRWVGDVCLGYKCQFAMCERRALLPNGKCAYAIKFKDESEEMFKEIEKSDYDTKVKSILSRKVGRKDMMAE